MGLVGWEAIDLTVTSAILAGIPLLFVGSHGAAKTEGAEVIARSLFGPAMRWALYECPNVQTDDLLGLPKPSSLNNDVYEFVGSPISVWNVDAICLDELTRAYPSTVAKLMEVVRTRRVYGITTSIKYVFATANPPTKEYTTHRLDAAVTARFSVVRVPDFSMLSDSQAKKVMTGTLTPTTWDIVTSTSKEQDEDAVATTLSIRSLLKRQNVHLSGRTCKYIAKMLAQSHRAAQLGASRTRDTLTTLVLSCIPEATGISTVSCDIPKVTSALHTFFESRLKRALPPITDWAAYMTAMTLKALSCGSQSDAEDLLVEVPKIIATRRAADVQTLLVNIIPSVIRYLPEAYEDRTVLSVTDLVRELAA